MVQTLNKLLYEHKQSALDVCKQCLNRIEQTKSLNAFITVLTENALKQAEESEKRQKDGSVISKLDGVPIAVKDNFCTYDVRTTCASRMLRNFISPYDATVVKRLKSAGAVLIGKTNLDEFAMGSGTVDSIFGPTKNIWGSGFENDSSNSEETDQNIQWRIAGGSSGGSAIAVATGSCLAALGSDTGGSTRNPASYCGVVGFKPTYGTVSRNGLIPLVNSMDVPGIIARKVDLVKEVFSVISGPDEYDSTTVDESLDPNDYMKLLDLTQIRVGIPKEYKTSDISPDILNAWNHVADLLSDAGVSIVEISMPHTEASIVTYSILNACEVASNMARYSGLLFGHRSSSVVSTNHVIAESRRDGFGPVVRSRILAGNFFLLKRNYEEYFMKAMKVRRLIADDFRNVWSSGVDFLLTPTTLTTAPLLSDFTSLDNRAQCATQDFCTQPANMAGCPAISIPVCLSNDGLPVSLQVMAPNFQDYKLLRFSKFIESTLSFPHLTL